jgi:hypothetical protein
MKLYRDIQKHQEKFEARKAVQFARDKNDFLADLFNVLTLEEMQALDGTFTEMVDVITNEINPVLMFEYDRTRYYIQHWVATRSFSMSPVKGTGETKRFNSYKELCQLIIEFECFDDRSWFEYFQDCIYNHLHPMRGKKYTRFRRAMIDFYNSLPETEMPRKLTKDHEILLLNIAADAEYYADEILEILPNIHGESTELRGELATVINYLKRSAEHAKKSMVYNQRTI